MEPLAERSRNSAARCGVRLQLTTCSRRDVLQTVAGLGLSLILPGMGVRAAESRGRERPKSLITLWLAGGPSQFETWDPHP